MTDNINLILQNRLLSEEVKRRVDQLAAINMVAATVSQSLDLDWTLTTALQAVINVVGAEAGGISLIDEEAGEVVLRAQHGWTNDFVSQPMRIPFGKGMSGQVIRTDHVVTYNNLDGTEELAIPSVRNERFRSIAMAPMHARGMIIGILSIMSSKPNSFSAEIISVLEAIADTVGVALDNARLFETALEEENKLSAILHSTADGIIATDQNGRIRLINHTAETMFDLDGAALVRTPLREIPINPEIRDQLLYALSSRNEATQESFEARLATGSILSITVSPVYVEKRFDQDSITDGWVIVLRDVTHLRESEIARAQFIQAAAHDMRNPLSVTVNSLHLLQNALNDQNSHIDEIIMLALSGANRLEALIDGLLKIEQIESGYGVHPTQIDMLDMIGEISAQTAASMNARQIHYEVEIDGQLPAIYADNDLIRRALINYLENAIKYSHEKGNITLHAFVKNNWLHIEVTDDGPGIPPEAQAHLFERFYRVPGTESIPGTGLGLAIVKSIIQKNGGNVYVRSQLGQGSTFGLTLALTPQLQTS